MIIRTEVNTLLLLTNTLNLEAVNPSHSHLFCTRRDPNSNDSFYFIEYNK
jgi:hypothetical protein